MKMFEQGQLDLPVLVKMLKLALTIGAMIVLAVNAFCQTASLRGQVFDESGGVVAKAPPSL